MRSPFHRSWNGFAAQPAGNGVPNPEAGLVQTGSFEIGRLPSLPTEVRSASVVLAADFVGLNPNGPGGLIAEFGGAGAGAYLGFDRTGALDGALIFRFGSGAERWHADTWYAVYDKATFLGDGTLVASIEFVSQGPSLARLFWRGLEQVPVTTSGPISSLSNWTGGGFGEYLTPSPSVPNNENATPVSFISATPMRSYAGQVVAL